MHRSESPNPTPVSPWAIGSSEINLAPQQAGRAQNLYRVVGHVDLVAAFPHMHLLGRSLTVEVGKIVALSMWARSTSKVAAPSLSQGTTIDGLSYPSSWAKTTTTSTAPSARK